MTRVPRDSGALWRTSKAAWRRPSQSSVGCHYREERGLFQCVELVPTRRRCNTVPQQRHYGLERTARALDLSQTLAGLSTALGIAAAHLVGLPLADSLAGLNEVLNDTQFSQVQRHANLQLAQA